MKVGPSLKAFIGWVAHVDTSVCLCVFVDRLVSNIFIQYTGVSGLLDVFVCSTVVSRQWRDETVGKYGEIEVYVREYILSVDFDIPRTRSL